MAEKYFYSETYKVYGKIHNNDSNRVVYNLRAVEKDRFRNHIHNELFTRFYKIYPDVKWLTEKEYLFQILRDK